MRAVCVIFLILVHFSESFSKEKKVKVESTVEYVENDQGELEYKRKSYLDLRSSWGARLSFSTAEQTPTNEALSQQNSPIQAELSLTKNFKFMSTGVEVGYLDTKWSLDNKINVLSLGVVAHLDGIFKTPYIVPLVGVGMASIDAQESGQDKETEDDFIPYYKVGLLFSLNWIDKKSAQLAFDDFGLLNTYIYVGIRKWAETNSDASLNVEIEPSPEFGIQLEF